MFSVLSFMLRLAVVGSSQGSIMHQYGEDFAIFKEAVPTGDFPTVEVRGTRTWRSKAFDDEGESEPRRVKICLQCLDWPGRTSGQSDPEAEEMQTLERANETLRAILEDVLPTRF